MEKSQPFSLILEVALGGNRSAIRELSEQCSEKGYNVSVRSIQKYKSGEQVPSYEVAELLLRELNQIISKDRLTESLKEGKRARTMFKKNVDASRTAIVQFKNIEIPGLSQEQVEAQVEKRIEENFGFGRSGFSRYIEKLIENDLKNI